MPETFDVCVLAPHDAGGVRYAYTYGFTWDEPEVMLRALTVAVECLTAAMLDTYPDLTVADLTWHGNRPYPLLTPEDL